MDLKKYCVNVAMEQFGKSRQLETPEERLRLINDILLRIEKTQNDLCVMTGLLQELFFHEREK